MNKRYYGYFAPWVKTDVHRPAVRHRQAKITNVKYLTHSNLILFFFSNLISKSWQPVFVTTPLEASKKKKDRKKKWRHSKKDKITIGYGIFFEMESD